MFDPQIDIKTSYGRTDEFIQHFARKSMTDLNFTFLQQLYHHAISHPETKFVVTPGMQMGLAIPDDMSAYFYAQVGIHRANRYHLCRFSQQWHRWT